MAGRVEVRAAVTFVAENTEGLPQNRAAWEPFTRRLMRALQGLGSAIVVCSVFSVFLIGLLGATWPFAIGSSIVLGLGIIAVVGTRASEKDVTADAAWREAALDLPPASDRRAMEATQTAMPGPEKARRSGVRIAGTRGAGARAAGKQGSVR
jgi:hypothetical protein